MTALIIVDEAEAELEEIRQYLNLRTRELGDRFLVDLRAAFAQIADSPESFPLLESIRSNSRWRRAVLAKFPYVIVFESDGETTAIIAVGHGHRKPGYWKTRLN